MSESPAPTDAAYDEPLLDQRVEVDPALDVESWRLGVPAKPACYLLEDGEGRPVLAATARDLRGVLVRRLGPDATVAGESADAGADAGAAGEGEAAPDGTITRRKIDYRIITRAVRYRIVHSRFEADWAYLDAATRHFPATWRRLTRHLRAHWISIDRESPYPRFTAAPEPARGATASFGPLPTSKAAQRCIEAIEDAFDLCRNHHLLLQTPNAVACAYKEMQRCPAPCDGTVPMDVYLAQLDAALEVLVDPRAWSDRLKARMRDAAAQTQYEAAGAAKTLLERAAPLFAPDASRLAPLDRFATLTLAPGSRKGRVRAFLAADGVIRCLAETPAGAREESAESIAETVRCIGDDRWRGGRAWVRDDVTTARLGLAAWHLFDQDRRSSDRGIVLRLDPPPDAQTIARAIERIADAGKHQT